MPLMQDTADRRRDPRRKLALFLVLVFGASTPFWLLLTSPGPAQASSLYLFGLMWVPALAAMATLFVFQRNLRGVGWGLGKPRYLLVGYLLPVVYAGVAYGIVWLSGLGRVDFVALPGSGPVRSPLVLIAGAATVGVVLSAFSAVSVPAARP